MPYLDDLFMNKKKKVVSMRPMPQAPTPPAAPSVPPAVRSAPAFQTGAAQPGNVRFDPTSVFTPEQRDILMQRRADKQQDKAQNRLMYGVERGRISPKVAATRFSTEYDTPYRDTYAQFAPPEEAKAYDDMQGSYLMGGIERRGAEYGLTEREGAEARRIAEEKRIQQDWRRGFDERLPIEEVQNFTRRGEEAGVGIDEATRSGMDQDNAAALALEAERQRQRERLAQTEVEPDIMRGVNTRIAEQTAVAPELENEARGVDIGGERARQARVQEAFRFDIDSRVPPDIQRELNIRAEQLGMTQAEYDFERQKLEAEYAQAARPGADVVREGAESEIKRGGQIGDIQVATQKHGLESLPPARAVSESELARLDNQAALDEIYYGREKQSLKQQKKMDKAEYAGAKEDLAGRKQDRKYGTLARKQQLKEAAYDFNERKSDDTIQRDDLLDRREYERAIRQNPEKVREAQAIMQRIDFMRSRRELNQLSPDQAAEKQFYLEQADKAYFQYGDAGMANSFLDRASAIVPGAPSRPPSIGPQAPVFGQSTLGSPARFAKEQAKAENVLKKTGLIAFINENDLFDMPNESTSQPWEEQSLIILQQLLKAAQTAKARFANEDPDVKSLIVNAIMDTPTFRKIAAWQDADKMHSAEQRGWGSQFDRYLHQGGFNKAGELAREIVGIITSL